MTIAFVVCTRNRSAELRRFLLSAARQSLTPQQLIIIDASDELSTIPRSLSERLAARGVEVIHVGSQPGLTLQRNKAAQFLKSDWVAFFDDDVALDRDYNRVFLEECEQIMAGGDVGGAQGTIINAPLGRPSRRMLDRFFLLTSNTETCSRFQASGNMLWQTRPVGRRSIVQALNGCCQAYPAKVMREISFNEGLPGYSYKEDVEFSRRARAFGDLWQFRDVRLMHFDAESRGRPNRRKLAYLAIYNDHFLYVMDARWREQVRLSAVTWASVGSLFVAWVSSVMRRDYRPLLGALEGVSASTWLHLKRRPE